LSLSYFGVSLFGKKLAKSYENYRESVCEKNFFRENFRRKDNVLGKTAWGEKLVAFKL
jgi:hypothetical protein